MGAIHVAPKLVLSMPRTSVKLQNSVLLESQESHRLAKGVRACGIGQADIRAAHRHKKQMIAGHAVGHQGPGTCSALKLVDIQVAWIFRALDARPDVAGTQRDAKETQRAVLLR